MSNSYCSTTPDQQNFGPVAPEDRVARVRSARPKIFGERIIGCRYVIMNVNLIAYIGIGRSTITLPNLTGSLLANRPYPAERTHRCKFCHLWGGFHA